MKFILKECPTDRAITPIPIVFYPDLVAQGSLTHSCRQNYGLLWPNAIDSLSDPQIKLTRQMELNFPIAQFLNPEFQLLKPEHITLKKKKNFINLISQTESNSITHPPGNRFRRPDNHCLSGVLSQLFQHCRYFGTIWILSQLHLTEWFQHLLHKNRLR